MTKIIDFERAKGFNTALPSNRISMEEKLNTIHDLIYDQKSGRAGCSSKNDVTDCIRKENAWTIFSDMEQKNKEIPRETNQSNIKTISNGGKLRQIRQGLAFIVPFIAVSILLLLLFTYFQ